MDMLWEDFNDELREIPGEGKRGGKKRALPRRRPGLMLIVKVLKTLLLIQKIKKRRNL
ncbi:hypothetical protein KSP39_PZI006083 [Platanthera zijinensis]|uniref:Uncharacterized protein n=1 Tax=Platanthera zijinensis TaxID=2320716 RepID=A0AAP0BSM7_9ASPA